jgi:hypothetical protein
MAEQTRTNGQEGTQATPRSIHRSPNYPMLSLRDAIDKAKLIYQHEKRNFTTAEVIQRDIGYSEGTGPAGRAVSSLKQYGLLDERNGAYGLSDKGFLFTYIDENSPERVAALREAALKPMIFKELVNTYPSGLPSDATLKAYLVGKKSFNPSAVENFIRIFKETITLAKALRGEYTPDRPSEDLGGGNTVEPQTTAQPATGRAAQNVHVFTWSLSMPRNVRAELRLSGEQLRKEDVSRLKKQIEALEESFDEEPSKSD